MSRIVKAAALGVALVGAPALAEQEPGGELNPEELTLRSVIARAERGEADMTICMQGYFAVKSGDYRGGRAIFDACAERGYAAAMHWRSYIEENGLGGPEDPVAAAEWDRRAAELGDPVGQFNYGLDLLRGHGAPQDPTRGRRFVDLAADAGFASAIELRRSDYDPEVVTPDADAWRYEADGRNW